MTSTDGWRQLIQASKIKARQLETYLEQADTASKILQAAGCKSTTLVEQANEVAQWVKDSRLPGGPKPRKRRNARRTVSPQS